jgi:tetratricopeptide (TPR) repeat protein
VQANRLRGNEEFKAGNNSKAVYFYTEAITIDDSDPRLYSNRAIAHLSLGHCVDAIADADRCNGIAPRDFVKHLNTKSAALARLGRKADARAEAQASLDRSPGNVRATELLRELGEATDDEDDVGSTGGSTTSGAGVAGIGSTIAQVLLQDTAMTKLVLTATRAAALVGVVVFMLSGMVVDAATGTWAYYTTLLAALLLNLFHSVRGAVAKRGVTLGLTMEFAGALFEQPSTPLIMLGATFVGSRPNFMVMWPMLCYEVMFLSGSLGESIPLVKAPLRQAGTLLIGALGNVPSFDTMTDEQRLINSHPVLGKTSAQAQLVLMLTMVIELAFPTRNIIGILLHGQNLMLQYAVNTFMQQEIQSLHGTVHAYAHHPSAPGFVGTAFDSVSSAVASFADIRARAAAEASRREASASGGAEAGAGGGGGGLMSSCAVM